MYDFIVEETPLMYFLVLILVFVYSVLLKIINFADVFLKYSVVVEQCELVKNDSEIVNVS